MGSPLIANPFAPTFEIDRFFVGRHQEEATAHLSYALREGEGFTVITGEQGVGKTSTCRAFIAHLDAARVSIAYLSGPMQTSGDLLRGINRQFGLECAGESTMDLTDALNGFLMQQRVAGRKVMVFIDDAQTLPVQVLEQVRLVSNLETTRDKLIQIVLVGEPGLVGLLDSRELRQMGQRVSVCYEIGPLTEGETGGYIRRRLGHPGDGAGPEFTREAVGVIHRHTHGIPRRINRTCATALELAQRSQAVTVDRSLAEASTGAFTQASAPRRGLKLPSVAAAVLLVILTLTSAALFLRRDRTPQEAPQAAVVLPLQAPPEPAPTPASPEPPYEEAAATAPAEPSPPFASRPTARPPEPAPAAPVRMTHSVQVGAFLQPENARELASRLTAKGVHAYILEVRDARGRRWQTVRVGDFPSRQTAQAHADEFARRERMATLVRPFGTF